MKCEWIHNGAIYDDGEDGGANNAMKEIMDECWGVSMTYDMMQGMDGLNEGMRQGITTENNELMMDERN